MYFMFTKVKKKTFLYAHFSINMDMFLMDHLWTGNGSLRSVWSDSLPTTQIILTGILSTTQGNIYRYLTNLSGY